jgi:hypothetical protein
MTHDINNQKTKRFKGEKQTHPSKIWGIRKKNYKIQIKSIRKKFNPKDKGYK